MDYFDKRMALDVIEDTLTALGPPENRGFAIGLCGGFYLCGLLSQTEWEAFLVRIAEKRGVGRAAPDAAGRARPTTATAMFGKTGKRM